MKSLAQHHTGRTRKAPNIVRKLCFPPPAGDVSLQAQRMAGTWLYGSTRTGAVGFFGTKQDMFAHHCAGQGYCVCVCVSVTNVRSSGHVRRDSPLASAFQATHSPTDGRDACVGSCPSSDPPLPSSPPWRPVVSFASIMSAGQSAPAHLGNARRRPGRLCGVYERGRGADEYPTIGWSRPSDKPFN